jgi:transcriptional regulator with XRE-family HTH domain
MDIRKLVGMNVRRLREDRGWSQEQLADISGLHRTYISGIERGVRNPTVSIVQCIAGALEVPEKSLFVREKREDA